MAIRWIDKLTVLDNGDIVDFNGKVVGHIDVDLIDDDYTGVYTSENPKEHFEGKCPYTNNPCDSFKCDTCPVEAEERAFMKNE